MNGTLGFNSSYNWVNFENEAQCFSDQINAWPTVDFSACNFTAGMVSYLNFTGNGGNSSYISAYCLNPPCVFLGAEGDVRADRLV
jgi:hypothetical protein